MTEGLSLSGMIESPMVIHLAQRPGPATGLPTRTEQGDLNFVLYAGHGEFPRVILTPGTVQEGFTHSRAAFNIAAKYQVPVFLLTDQFFVDSSQNSPKPDMKWNIEKHIIETKKGYRRYELTNDGISPRGIPGYGEGFVVADSDEHDEEGHITEDLNLRPKMVEKRLYKKLKLLRQNAIAPSLVGANEFRILAVTWGSNYYAVKEAIASVDFDDVAMLHFSQVYPLSETIVQHLSKAELILAIENNATGQFADLLQRETGVMIPTTDRLLSYNGLPFSVEEIADFVREKRKEE